MKVTQLRLTMGGKSLYLGTKEVPWVEIHNVFPLDGDSLEQAVGLVQAAENAADFQPQLDRMLTAKRLFDEGYALLKDLR